MKTKLSLPSGTTGFTNDAGQWICTGSQMGRPNILPEKPDQAIKLRLQRVPFVDGDYDRWGAYWGCPANVWAYTNRVDASGGYDTKGAPGQLVELFVRGNTRDQAKSAVRALLSLAKFYR